MSKVALIDFLILGLFVAIVDCCPYARHKKRDLSNEVRSKLTIYAAEETPFTVLSALTSTCHHQHWETGTINAVKLNERRMSTIDLSIRLAPLTMMTTKIQFTLNDKDVEKTWTNYINNFEEVCPLAHVEAQYVHLCSKKLAVLKNIVLPNVVTFPDEARHRDNILRVELLTEEDTVLFSFLLPTFEE